MKTIKTFYVTFAFIFLGLVPILAMGQSMPHTFTANTAAKASEMNANFEYLLERVGGIRETTVNCGNSGTGSGINTAIQNGYNSIVISGICKENIYITGASGGHLLRIRGANNDASQDKIIDNSNYTEHVLHIGAGATAVVDNITISGGDRGISAWGNSYLSIDNSKVEGYKNRGINLYSGSYMYVRSNLTIDGSYSGATTDERGLSMGGGAVAGVGGDLTITNNQKVGIYLDSSNFNTYSGNLTLTANARGIDVKQGSNFSSSSNITISGSTNKAISSSQSIVGLYHDGSISVTNTTGKILQAWMSNMVIHNFSATGDGSTESILGIYKSNSYLANLTISNSGEQGIDMDDSDVEFDNLTSSNNKESGVSADRSRIKMKNSVISGNNGDGIIIDENSSLEMRSSTITSNVDEGIKVEGNSRLMVRDASSITNNGDAAIQINEGSSIYVKDSTITAISAKNAIRAYNRSSIILSEGSGTTLISTTNADAIQMQSSHGEIRDGVTVTSDTTGIYLGRDSFISIEDGATVNGSSNGGSIVGSVRSTINIETGSTISSPIWCGEAGTTIVRAGIQLDNGSYSFNAGTFVGTTCIKIAR